MRELLFEERVSSAVSSVAADCRRTHRPSVSTPRQVVEIPGFTNPPKKPSPSSDRFRLISFISSMAYSSCSGSMTPPSIFSEKQWYVFFTIKNIHIKAERPATYPRSSLAEYNNK